MPGNPVKSKIVHLQARLTATRPQSFSHAFCFTSGVVWGLFFPVWDFFGDFRFCASSMLFGSILELEIAFSTVLATFWSSNFSFLMVFATFWCSKCSFRVGWKKTVGKQSSRHLSAKIPIMVGGAGGFRKLHVVLMLWGHGLAVFLHRRDSK